MAKSKKPTGPKTTDYSSNLGRQSIKFKEVNPNFEKILADQRKNQKDEKFAISDSLSDYMDKTIREQGFGSMEKLKDAGIRDDVINYVIGYQTGDLDAIKGMDFNEAQQLQADTQKTIQELEGIVNEPELLFIKQTVGKTNARLGELLNVSTRMNLAFRDLKKEFSALKLAERFGLTRIPFLGRPLERAVQAEKAAERRAIGLKQSLARKGLRESIKFGGDTDFDLSMSEDFATDNQVSERAVKRATGVRPDLATMMGGKEFGKEEAIEEERESDLQFKTQKGLLEDILFEQKKTNELLSGEKTGGLLSGAADFAKDNALALGGIPLLFKNVRKTLARGLSTLLPAKLGGDFLSKYGAKTPVDTDTKLKTGSKDVDADKATKTAQKELKDKAGKTSTKALAKGGLKFALKKLPIIGLAVSIPFAIEKLARGDFLGAGLEIAEGGAAMVPGVGTAASVGLGTINLGRDVVMANNEDKMMKTAEISENAVERASTDETFKTTTINTVNSNNVTTVNNTDTIMETPRTIGINNSDTISYINKLR
jgi:hypothetical protein